MVIKINSEEQLVKVATELIHVIANLRKFTKLWEETHGVELKRNKKYYEQKADELIARLQVENHKHKYQVKIEVDAKL